MRDSVLLLVLLLFSVGWWWCGGDVLQSKSGVRVEFLPGSLRLGWVGVWGVAGLGRFFCCCFCSASGGGMFIFRNKVTSAWTAGGVETVFRR